MLANKRLLQLCAPLLLLLLLSTSTAVSQAGPQVHLNHVYIVLDSATFADIAGSTFLSNEFSTVRRQESSTGDGRSWSGLYLHGERTYLEFFPPGNPARPRGRPGFSGIALSVERTGELAHVASRLRAVTGLELHRAPATRVEGNDTIPWFEQVAVSYPGYPDSIAQLYTWVMEVRPEFMRRVIYADLPGYEAGVTRREYLARRFSPDRYLRDITGVTVALEPHRAKRFVAELAAHGYTIRTRADTTRARGPGVEFLIVPSTRERFGIVELRFSLLRPKRGQTRYTFGDRSALTFQGRGAVWTFHDLRD